mmetsp:Transcript_16038/g.30228  ORF Transcript_16038/g.30228 Transcript_16038/m.30228 type:complete len:218 (-) Transcript_16038:218-871(-)
MVPGRAKSRHAAPHRSPDPPRRPGPQPRPCPRAGAQCPCLGRRQGQCLRPRHRARLPRPAGGRWLRAAGPGRGRAAARAGLARPHPAAGGRVRAARPGAVLAAQALARGALRAADRLAGHAQDPRAAPGVPEAELGHEPARLPAGRLPRGLCPAAGPAPGRRDRADDALLRRRRAAPRPGRHRPPARRLRGRHRRPGRRAQHREQRRHAAPPGPHRP